MAGGWKRPDVVQRNKSTENRERMKFQMLGENNPSKRPEIREKLSKIRGHRNFREGCKHTEETKKKMSESAKRVGTGKWNKGENSCHWLGGISFEPYTVDWTETLKRSIRERDHYTCRMCGKQQEEEAFSVHHIDYNKNNCSPENLITLCRSCHAKTNSNREYYLEYFQKLLK